MSSFSLAVVESNELFLEGLKRVFSRSAFKIVYHCQSLAELAEVKLSTSGNGHVDDGVIDAVIIDTAAQAESSEFHTARFRRSFPDAKIILMTELESCREVAKKYGHVDGVVLKSSCVPVLIKAMELIALGERVFPAAIWEGAPAETAAVDPALPVQLPPGLEKLSGREEEVLELLCGANSNKIIARKLGITEATVKVHVKAILRKTRTKNRTEAALLMSSRLGTRVA